MKNIAIMVHSLNGGGAERIAGLLSKELTKYYHVYLFLFNTENIIYEYGGTIVDIGRSGPFYEYDISIYKKKYHIDYAISFLETMNFANIRTKGSECVLISERSVQSLAVPKHTSETLKIQKYYDDADAIIACSDGVKFDLIENYHVNNKITTIYNFIDKDHIIQSSCGNLPEEVTNFLGGAEFFINVGRLHPQKNQRRLILQFSYFHRVNPAVKLLIVGSGVLESELSAYIRELALDDCVRIIPYTANPFIYMAKAKALILASHYEGLPNVILEAMVLQCPLIAVDCLSGPRELLMDEADYKKPLALLQICKRGILVCNHETEDDGTTRYMARAMELIGSSAAMAEEIRRNEHKFMEEYTNARILDQWLEVIKECKSKRGNDFYAEEENKLKNARHIVIYGAGLAGKSMFLRLSNCYTIDSFVVSKRKEEEKQRFGIPVKEITELDSPPDETAVIIGVADEFQDDVINTLWEYGYTQMVFPFIEPLSYTFYANNKNYDAKAELQDLYRLRIGEDIDIDHPQTFNQKLQWMKLYDNDPIKTLLADKYAVRAYVSQKIGEQYLVPLLGVWDSFDEIDFDRLPDHFVLKCTHGSGMNMIVNDKSQMDYRRAKQKFDHWMQVNYAHSGFEMNYANIVPRIIAEEMLEIEEDSGDIPDYKLMCFHGKVKCSFVCSERYSPEGLKVTFYDTDWNMMPFERHYPRSQYPISKPKNYNEMVRLAEILAGDLTFVRVDFYEVNGEIYFGELTFYPGSGVEEFTPSEWDKVLGDWINLT